MNRTANKASRLPNGAGCPSAPPPSPNGSNGDRPPANPTATDGRDPASGRFLPGWKGGPGNPHARAVAARRKALLGAVTPEDIARVGKKLLEMAEGGDVPAIALLFKYIIGQPRPARDPDWLDVEEFDLLRRSPTLAECHDALDRVAAGYAALMALHRQPADGEGYEALVAKVLEKAQAELRRNMEQFRTRFPLSSFLDDEDDVNDDED